MITEVILQIALRVPVKSVRFRITTSIGQDLIRYPLDLRFSRLARSINRFTYKVKVHLRQVGKL